MVNRPCDGRHGAPVATAVFAEVEHGDYELYVRPSGPVRLTVTVRGAEVSYASVACRLTPRAANWASTPAASVGRPKR